MHLLLLVLCGGGGLILVKHPSQHGFQFLKITGGHARGVWWCVDITGSGMEM